MAEHDDFDPSAPEKRLRARHFPWRPVAVVAGLAFVVGVAFGFPIIDMAKEWVWPDPESRSSKKDLLAVFNVPSAPWNPAPPVTPEPVVLHVDREVRLPALAAETQAPPETPAPAPMQPSYAPPKTTRIGMVNFAPAAPPQLDILDGRIPAQAQGCALVPGMAIYGTFRDVVRWDLGGQINGEVTRPVVSPERPENVLIPQGATLVGYARVEELKRGMDMAPAPLWDHVWWIDSDTGQRRIRKLHDATGADIAGVNGAGGEVNQHWGTVAALVAAATVTDFISSISVSIGDSESVNARIGGSSAGRILEGVANQMLDIRPTITTPAGTQFLVKPTKVLRFC